MRVHVHHALGDRWNFSVPQSVRINRGKVYIPHDSVFVRHGVLIQRAPVDADDLSKNGFGPVWNVIPSLWDIGVPVVRQRDGNGRVERRFAGSRHRAANHDVHAKVRALIDT